MKLLRIRFHEDKPSGSRGARDGQVARIAKLIDDFFATRFANAPKMFVVTVLQYINCLAWKKGESDIWFGKVSYTGDVKFIFDGWKCNMRKLLSSSTIHFISHGEVLVSC